MLLEPGSTIEVLESCEISKHTKDVRSSIKIKEGDLLDYLGVVKIDTLKQHLHGFKHYRYDDQDELLFEDKFEVYNLKSFLDCIGYEITDLNPQRVFKPLSSLELYDLDEITDKLKDQNLIDFMKRIPTSKYWQENFGKIPSEEEIKQTYILARNKYLSIITNKIIEYFKILRKENISRVNVCRIMADLGINSNEAKEVLEEIMGYEIFHEQGEDQRGFVRINHGKNAPGDSGVFMKNPGRFAIQYMEEAKTLKEAEKIFNGLIKLKDYLGGRIIPPGLKSSNYRIQVFYKDSSNISDDNWLPDGLRRVIVPESMARILGF